MSAVSIVGIVIACGGRLSTMRSTHRVLGLLAAALLLSGCSTAIQGSPRSDGSSSTATSSATPSATPTPTPELTMWAASFCTALKPVLTTQPLTPAPTKEYADAIRVQAMSYTALSAAVRALGDPPSINADGLAASYADGFAVAAGALNKLAMGVDGIIGSPTAAADLQILGATLKMDVSTALRAAQTATPPTLDTLLNALPQCQ